MGPWSWWLHVLSALPPLSLCSLCATSAPAARLRVARRPHGLRACYARPTADCRIRGAPPTASRRSAAPKGLGEAELPRRHVRPRTCTDTDTEAQKKAAENQRLMNAQRSERFLLPLHGLQHLHEDILGWILGYELRTLALLA